MINSLFMSPRREQATMFAPFPGPEDATPLHAGRREKVAADPQPGRHPGFEAWDRAFAQAAGQPLQARLGIPAGKAAVVFAGGYDSSYPHCFKIFIQGIKDLSGACRTEQLPPFRDHPLVQDGHGLFERDFQDAVRQERLPHGAAGPRVIDHDRR
jgi:hypothetical protein